MNPRAPRLFSFGALCLSLTAGLAGCGVPAADEAGAGAPAALDIKLPIGPIAGVTATTPWVARHGMTAAEYQAEFDKWIGQGYRLTDISGSDVNGETRYAAIWEKKAGPAWAARHGMTAAQYQAEFDSRLADGYRLVVIDGYESGGQARYAAIWEKAGGPAWSARHGMTAAQYQAEFTARARAGYRLTWVQGYGVGDTAYYAAIFEQSSGPAQVARHGLTSAQYQTEFDSWTSQGYRLAQISAYDVGGTDYYAAIWDKAAGGAWAARHRMTAQDYQLEFTDRLLQGYRLKQVDGNAIGASARYAARWEAEPDAQDGTYCQDGKCFALGRLADRLEAGLVGNNAKYGFEIRRGLSVIRRAQGPKRTAADAPASDFTAFDRFNPASLSKTVTAVAALQLLAQQRISIDTPVYSYLSPLWSIPAVNRTITFKELLNHTSGFRGENAGGGYEYDNMKLLMEHAINPADKVDHYENVNYSMLRILVAALKGPINWASDPGPVTAARFINYVNEGVFSPLGIYDVQYKSAGAAPTLFYPSPPGAAHGTDYGDWSLIPGSAGNHASVHELAVFAAATFGGLLLSPAKLEELKQFSLGFGDYGTLPDGSKCFGKSGYFPGSQNGGAEENSALIWCENGVTGMLVINGAVSAKGLFESELPAAFTP